MLLGHPGVVIVENSADLSNKRKRTLLGGNSKEVLRAEWHFRTPWLKPTAHQRQLLVTYAAVTSSLVFSGSFSATRPFSTKSISMPVAVVYLGQTGVLLVPGSPVLANDTQ